MIRPRANFTRRWGCDYGKLRISHRTVSGTKSEAKAKWLPEYQADVGSSVKFSYV